MRKGETGLPIPKRAGGQGARSADSRAFGEAAEEALGLRQQVPVIGEPAEADAGQGRVIC